MTATLDGELVTIVGVDMNDFEVKISYISSTSTGSLKIKQKKVDWSRQLNIASGVTL